MADWSDAEIRKVKTMWRHGATATEIADALGKGFTRGSVLGKIHRLGLKKAEEPKAKARLRVTATKPAARAGALPAAKVQPKATAKPPASRASATAKPAPARSPAPVKPAIARPASKPKPTGAEGACGRRSRSSSRVRRSRPGRCRSGRLVNASAVGRSATCSIRRACSAPPSRTAHRGARSMNGWSIRAAPDRAPTRPREQPRFAAAGGRSRF